MPTYALVVSTVVQNVVVASSPAAAQSVLPGSTAVDIGSQRVSVGDTYNGTVFSPGPARVPLFLPEALQDVFGGRVTPAELTALGNLINTDSAHRVMWDMFAGGSRITTEVYLNYLVSRGTISASRRDQFKV